MTERDQESLGQDRTGYAGMTQCTRSGHPFARFRLMDDQDAR